MGLSDLLKVQPDQLPTGWPGWSPSSRRPRSARRGRAGAARAAAAEPGPDGESYPELVNTWDRISSIAYAEEDAFRRTLTTGTQIFDLAVTETKQSGSRVLPGAGRSSCTTRTASRST
jgi:hypothetical protein